MHDIITLARFVRPYWRPAIAAFILLTALVFLDLAIPRLIQRIIDEGIAKQNQDIVIQTGLLMVGISLLSVLVAIGNNFTSIQVGEGVARDLRLALFQKIQTLSFSNLDELRTGQLLVRLTSDVAAVQRYFQINLRIGTRAPMLMIGSIILMFSTSYNLALALLPLLLITSVIVVLFVLRTEPLYRMVQQRLDVLNTVLQENIAGSRLIKAFVRGDAQAARFLASNDDFATNSIAVMQFMALMMPVLTMCVNIGMVVVIWWGGWHVATGDMTVGQIVAFTNYLLTTMTPLVMMTMLSNTWASGVASAKRVNEVLDVVPAVQAHTDAIVLQTPLTGQIVFEDVRFFYNVQLPEPVLDAIDLVVAPGQTVAVLGATGAGKSTLINLVPRFYDVTSGRVLIDGMDVRHIDHGSLMQQVAIVPQETILFSGSVRDNIRYGAPDADEAAVVAAAQAAQAHEFILKLPSGYDTHVAERGVNLSGGQKQRIAIARALLTKPRILILDDSTSAVDVETETKIQQALAAMGSAHTTLVVAQRISTVLNADVIVVLDRGRIVAQGTHRELMQHSAIYQEIYASQLGDGVLQRIATDAQ
ncbi:MAG: ABC transporter ATP-binding protein/permease [Chloroflexaceae bacterium]|jgi:ATP-binding cassette subfamily B multidrug efflux pump|nr:ABC transporter ATP-binding protein/permease [Chloroflexaceae bacterium]